MNIRYTLDLFCWDVPPETRLHKILVQGERGHYYTPYRKRYVKDGRIEIALEHLESYREDMIRCSKAYTSIAYYPDYMVAECTTRISAAFLKRLADCGSGLEVAVYPHGNDNMRYGGNMYFVVATNAERANESEKNGVKLLPGIRRSLNRRGLKPIGCMGYDLSFSDAAQLMAAYMPEQHQEPAIYSLNKFLGEFVFPSFNLSKEMIAKVAENRDDLELYFNFPQRKGKKLNIEIHEKP